MYLLKGVGGGQGKIGIPEFDWGPTYREVGGALGEVLEQEDAETHVELVAVNTDEEAQKLRFPGSPTRRVDGRDLFPAGECGDWRLGCRVYATPEGLKGSPTTEMLREALIREGGDSA